MSPLFSIMLFVAAFYIVLGLGARYAYDHQEELDAKIKKWLENSESKTG